MNILIKNIIKTMEVESLKNKLKNECVEWAKTITLALFMGLIITLFIVPTVVSGESMYPTLQSKDYLIINKVAYKKDEPIRGDIIVFNSELPKKDGGKKNLVKRIIGLPGEHLVIKEGRVYINEKLIKEPYLDEVYTDGDIDILIPNGYYFTMGDNRDVSRDSRDKSVGVIKQDEIVGKVSLRLFPFEDIGTVN